MNQSIKSEQTLGSHNLLADLQYCFPTLDTAFYLQDLQGVDTGEIDKALVIFATILVRDWDPLFVGQWLAPVHVDKAYQAASDQKVYLQACERLIDGIRPLLLQGFEGDDPIIDQLYAGAPTETVQRAKLIRRALRSTSQFKEWIRYRNQTPVEQFLEALSTIRIQISDDSIRDVPERQKQTVLYGEWYRDQLRLKELSRHFHQYVRSEKVTENLRGVWATLKQIKDVDLNLLLEKKEEFEQVREDIPGFHYDHRKYNISELPITFPEIHFAGLEGEWTITNEVNKYFWGEIFHLLYARKEWAWRAYNTLCMIIGEKESSSPFLDLKEEDIPPKPVEGKGPVSDDKYKNFYDGLTGNWHNRPDQLDWLLGKNGLSLYDTDARKPFPEQAGREWASVYWALVKAKLLRTMAPERAAHLITSTFKNAKIDRSAIERMRDKISNKNSKDEWEKHAPDYYKAMKLLGIDLDNQ